MTNYYSVVSCNDMGIIAKDGNIPWKSKKDMKIFKDLTIGDGNNCVVMGRKTFESIGKPLKQRMNLILTHKSKKYNKQYSDVRNVLFFNNYEDILKYAVDYSYDSIINIGGRTLYNLGMDMEILKKYNIIYDGIYLSRFKNNISEGLTCEFLTELSLELNNYSSMYLERYSNFDLIHYFKYII